MYKKQMCEKVYNTCILAYFRKVLLGQYSVKIMLKISMNLKSVDAFEQENSIGEKN